MKRVLLIEDQWPFIAQGILEAMGGFTISYVQRGDRAIGLFLNNRYDLVLLDLRLPGLDGLSVLEALRRIEPDLPVIVVSAWTDKAVREQAMGLGAAAFFQKPPNWRAVHRKMGEVIARREAAAAGPRETRELAGEASLRLARVRRLNLLKEKQALMGLSTPPEVLMEIEDLEKVLGEYRE